MRPIPPAAPQKSLRKHIPPEEPEQAGSAWNRWPQERKKSCFGPQKIMRGFCGLWTASAAGLPLPTPCLSPAQPLILPCPHQFPPPASPVLLPGFFIPPLPSLGGGAAKGSPLLFQAGGRGFSPSSSPSRVGAVEEGRRAVSLSHPHCSQDGEGGTALSRWPLSAPPSHVNGFRLWWGEGGRRTRGAGSHQKAQICQRAGASHVIAIPMRTPRERAAPGSEHRLHRQQAGSGQGVRPTTPAQHQS